jgi:hypothetical protein
LFWTDAENQKHPPGFGLKGTQVHFTLSKNMALIGDFEGEEDSLTASKETVALINSNILAQAKNWIYTANKDFYFLSRTGECMFGIENYWKYLDILAAQK